MSQTMLLSKRLTTLLTSSTTPQLHTLLLLSLNGKLLSSASPSMASVLRTQATLAVTLWSSYQSLPLPNTSNASRMSGNGDAETNMITIQLEQGVMCIRLLTPGLLFVAIGENGGRVGGGGEGMEIGSVLGSPRENCNSHSNGVIGIGKATSEAGSVGSERGQGGIWGIRRRTEEVGNLLEEKLEGFELSSER
ncbi:hypothetical protein BJ878DRAFT_483111 [Calycina marina]|uniref:Uncharacterized protein n=1 Tax=Calycina marina TaxID=1763456 RepID=A0A9P8CBU1_9HELO|nr:hypothetical protein BJ878DRAFT_483111 [Calycina marina]